MCSRCPHSNTFSNNASILFVDIFMTDAKKTIAAVKRTAHEGNQGSTPSSVNAYPKTADSKYCKFFLYCRQLLLPRITMLFCWIVVYSPPSSEGCSKGRSMPCVNLSPCPACHKYCSYFKFFILALPNEWSLGKAEVKLHLYSRLNFISLS